MLIWNIDLWGLLQILTLLQHVHEEAVYILQSSSSGLPLSLCEMAQRRLKYCLKGLFYSVLSHNLEDC